LGSLLKQHLLQYLTPESASPLTIYSIPYFRISYLFNTLLQNQLFLQYLTPESASPLAISPAISLAISPVPYFRISYFSSYLFNILLYSICSTSPSLIFYSIQTISPVPYFRIIYFFDILPKKQDSFSYNTSIFYSRNNLLPHIILYCFISNNPFLYIY